MHNVNWDDLRIVEACKRAGSFSRAAAELHLNHSSISRRVTQLEAELGVTLMRRTPNGLSFTEAGERVVEQVHLMSSAATAAKNMAAASGDLTGKIRFQTVDATAINLMPYLSEFSKTYPGIEIDLVLSQDFADLGRGDADVVLRASNKPPDSYVGTKVAEHAVALFGTSELLSRYQEGISLEKLPWVAWTDGLTDGWIRSHVPNAQIVMRVSTAFGLARAVRAGIGIGHLACYGVARDEKFVCLRGPEPELALEIWLLAHRSARNNRKVQAFTSFLREKIKHDRDVIEGRFGNPRHPLSLPLTESR